AKTLLCTDGLFYTSIDSIEVAKLRLLSDNIFGADNFLADIAWEKRYTRSNNAKLFYSLKDTILAYRGGDKVTLLREPRTAKSEANYSNPDNDPRGLWISSSYVNPATKAERPNLVYAIENPFTGEDVVHPTHAWKYEPEVNQQHVEDNRLYWGTDGSYQYPRLKSFLSEMGGMVPIDVWHYRQSGTTDEGGNELKALFGKAVFDNPKPSRLIERMLGFMNYFNPGDIALDFFAGSGTTAHAVINLNREDRGVRKYILVEQGSYFDTVLKPRIQKLIYAAEWKDGQPVEGSAGSSHAFQYLRLESYEDTLDNLDLDTKAAPAGLFPPERDDYLLRYFLDHETRQSRLNVESFATPFDYQLRVRRNGVETRVGVDLVETANFLLGLTVQARRVYEHQGRTYRAVFGTAGDQSVVVIWRDTAGLDLEAEAAFIRQLRLPKSAETSEVWEPDRVYVNGDSHVPNAQPIETVFMNAMRGAATVRRGGN
ncbi:MAG: site-specific DNA-methyltransferase, partial [Chloroflexi bacterium]|nr:site-specific DNA-methyltransferase [Chloroflexota bacterium]